MFFKIDVNIYNFNTRDFLIFTDATWGTIPYSTENLLGIDFVILGATINTGTGRLEIIATDRSIVNLEYLPGSVGFNRFGGMEKPGDWDAWAAFRQIIKKAQQGIDGVNSIVGLSSDFIDILNDVYTLKQLETMSKYLNKASEKISLIKQIIDFLSLGIDVVEYFGYNYTDNILSYDKVNFKFNYDSYYYPATGFAAITTYFAPGNYDSRASTLSYTVTFFASFSLEWGTKDLKMIELTLPIQFILHRA